jgi:hypothetical protein
MNFFEVLAVLLSEADAARSMAVFSAVVFVYYLLFKRRLRSVFDPLVYVVAMSAVSTTLLLLMYAHGLVSSRKVMFVLATLGLFYAGFLAADRSRRPLKESPKPGVAIPSATLITLFAAQFVVFALIYGLFGVPLLLDSRLSQFAGSGGFGVLTRTATGLEFVCVLLAIMARRQTQSGARFWANALLLQFIVTSLLSGSKGALLGGLFAWYLALLYETGRFGVVKRVSCGMKAAIALVVASPLAVIAVQTATEGADPLASSQALLVRVAAEGDAYAYFLGNDAIDTIARTDWLAPLRQLLVPLRLMPAQTQVNPGFEVITEVLGIDSPDQGPNSRLAIYLLFFYGEGGLVLAPLLGALLGFARNNLVRQTRRSPVVFAVAATVYVHMTKLEVDPQLTIAGLFGLLLVSPVLLLASLVGTPRRARRISAAPSIA